MNIPQPTDRYGRPPARAHCHRVELTNRYTGEQREWTDVDVEGMDGVLRIDGELFMAWDYTYRLTQRTEDYGITPDGETQGE